MNTDTLLNLPPDRRSKIEGELQPGERIVWLDQPIPRLFTIRTIPMVLFAIPWIAFSIFWMAGAAGLLSRQVRRSSGPRTAFALFGLPFLLIGVGMLLSPVWMRRMLRGTYYVITDQRAIIFQRGFGMNTRSFAGQQLQALGTRERSDGSGDITFNAVLARAQATPAGVQMNGFFSIRNVKKIEGMLVELAKKPA